MEPASWRMVRNAALVNLLVFAGLLITALSLTAPQTSDCRGDAEMCAGLTAGLQAGAQAVAELFKTIFIVLGVVTFFLTIVAEIQARTPSA